MNPFRSPTWLPVAGLLVPVALMLGWLLLVFGGDRRGAVPLPDQAGSTVEVLSRRLGPLTHEQVAQAAPEEWQQRASAAFFSPANANAAGWVRVTLRNPTDRSQWGVLALGYLFNDRVEAWIPSTGSGQAEEGSEWQRLPSGEAVPAKEKAIAGREAAFPVEVPARGQRAIYLRFEDRFYSTALPVWWPNSVEFHVAITRGWIAEGIYLGGLLALLGYNTLLWLRLRLPDIGWYVLYLAATGAFMMLVRVFFPALGFALGSPALETLLVVAMALSAFCLTQFARVFLELPNRLPRGDRVARWLAGGLLAIGLGALSLPWLEHSWWLGVAVTASGIAHVALIVLALMAWRAGVWQARLFVLAFGFLFAGSVASVVNWWLHDVTDASQRWLMIGSALEMLLLSLAVAERFAQAQRDKVEAQERLVAETEQRRLIEETYADELEIEVRERTRELEEANADKDRMLAVVGHDLRGPLTGLMRSADEAAGDFAREAARTGRALLLLIEDLVLWARLRAGTRVLATHPARAVLAPAIALHHALAERGGTELILDVPEGLRVETDLVLVQTLVRNLLANALKFARTRVVLRAEENARGGVCFIVGNDGPALSAEVAARIAAEEDGPMTATGGLGLRLCREICRALGMKLEARSPAAGGTEFGFTLNAAATTAVANK